MPEAGPCPARGDEIDRAAERVAAEQRAVAREDLDAVDVVHRQQVEVDLRGLGLVHPHAVEEDRHALRQADDRRRVEAAAGEVELVGAAEIVVGREAGHALDRVREDARLVGVHLLGAERGDPGRHAGADRRAGGGPDAADHLDGRQLVRRRVGALPCRVAARRATDGPRSSAGGHEQHSSVSSDGFLEGMSGGYG